MSALVEFLNARLDEDEQAARAAMIDGRDGRERWDVIGSEPFERVVHDGIGDRVADDAHPEHARHIARHDPARVLREVEATRELVRLAERAHDYHETFMNGFGAALEKVLRLYAAAHADHPDYLAEWRP